MTWTAWLQVFLSALGGGAITLVGTWLAGHQAERRRRESDRNKGREEWFRRLQWATEMANSEEQRRRIPGLDMIEQLISSDLATPDDIEFALAAARDRWRATRLPEVPSGVDEPDVTVDNEGSTDHDIAAAEEG